jgi:predicted outer membrane repeat protein
VSINHSTFTGNKATGSSSRAGAGGAIDVEAVVVIGNFGKTTINAGAVTFSGNVATGDGGAINGRSTELSIVRGVFADNSAAGSGGAVFLGNASSLHSIFANTLFVRNTAPSGSAYNGDDADFINSTVDSNNGLAISNSAPHQLVHITFSNSIISNNPLGGCGPAGLFDDAGHNLQFPGTDCGASINVGDPHLDTMYIPLPKSPPMGNGNLSVCMSPPINGRDVYGVGRPSGGHCTIGAAEGDIQVLVYKRTRKGRGGQCDCGTTLLKQLQKIQPIIP